MSPAALFWTKVVFALVVLGVGIGGATIPWARRGPRSSERALALSDTFAGGVLGGAGLIHLLGGGIDGFETAYPTVAYPVALVLAGAGFLLVLLIESLTTALGHGDHGPPPPAHSPAIQHETSWHPDTPSARHPVILLVVLSIHSIIIGLALGSQTAVSGAVVVLMAVIAHKGAAGFALGVGFERAGFTRRQALPRLASFAVMTPIGVLAGAVVGWAAASRIDLLFEATFNSLGAGTFLYIAALDIIRTEFDDPRFHGSKWTATALGFGLMALIAVWL